MADKRFDRVQETTAVTGTGAATLLGAAAACQAFGAVLSDTDTAYYCIRAQLGNQWEVGLGTYNSGTNALTRTSILSGSNGASAVNFSAGTKDIYICLPAEKAVLVGDIVPGGSQYCVQVNDGTDGFHGDDGFTYNYTTGVLATLYNQLDAGDGTMILNTPFTNISGTLFSVLDNGGGDAFFVGADDQVNTANNVLDDGVGNATFNANIQINNGNLSFENGNGIYNALAGQLVINPNSDALIDNSSIISVGWSQRVLNDDSGTISIDWNNRNLAYPSTSAAALAWGGGDGIIQMYDGVGNVQFSADNGVITTLNNTIDDGAGNGSFPGNLDIANVAYVWPTSNSAGVLTDDGSGNLSWAPAGGTPGGAQYNVQVNDGSGGFHGDSGLSYNYSTGAFTTLYNTPDDGTGASTWNGAATFNNHLYSNGINVESGGLVMVAGFSANALTLSKGYAAVGGAPLYFNSTGSLLTTPENGAMEFDGTNLYITISGARKTVVVV